jgi:hypothetical protein
MLKKPAVFIGSSNEAARLVDALQSHLEDVAEVKPWKYGIFKSGESALESLMKVLKRVDFAVLILTPDDLVESRGGTRNSPRDNVIFEIGLFIGQLGRERVFILSERDSDLKIPSDLLGITTIQYRGSAPAEGFEGLRRCTRSAFRELESHMEELGSLSSAMRYGMLEYSDSVRDRESQYMDIIESATSQLYINGTALSIMTLNSWGKIVTKSQTVSINLLMLDPQLAENAALADLIETTYRKDVLHAARVTVERISTRVRQLPDGQRANIKLYFTRYFMPIAVAVADPNSGHGKMVVEIIGASSADAEYFSRPRYVLEEDPADRAMFGGYWRQLQYLFSKDRAAICQFDSDTRLA